jgi:hypothetical protein
MGRRHGHLYGIGVAVMMTNEERTKILEENMDELYATFKRAYLTCLALAVVVVVFLLTLMVIL